MAIAAALIAGTLPPLTVSVTRSYVSGSRNGIGNCTTSSTTVIVNGGSGTPSYSWAYLSGDAVFSATAATSATTAFTTSLDFGEVSTATWRCTVTVGAEVATVDVEMVASEMSMNYL